MSYFSGTAARTRCETWQLVVWVLCAACLCAPGAAATGLYHSPGDDGAPAVGPPSVPEGGVQSVYLYVDGGAAASQAGSACHAGQGDEVCGFLVTLTGQGGLTVNAFNADPGADLQVEQSLGSIVIQGLDAVSPTPGPQRIGELLVNAASGGSLELSSGEVIGADLSSELLPTSTLVTVPEPGALVGLCWGLTLLRRLERGRARR